MSHENEGSDQPNRRQKIKQHLKDNKKTYLACAGTAVVVSAVTGVVVLKYADRLPVEISQIAKNQALINWRPEIHQYALVKRCCQEPIPVLDKLTGERYASINRAAVVTGETVRRISTDAQGLQERFEALPDTVFA